MTAETQAAAGQELALLVQRIEKHRAFISSLTTQLRAMLLRRDELLAVLVPEEKPEP